jgi:hypothetical protein
MVFSGNQIDGILEALFLSGDKTGKFRIIMFETVHDRDTPGNERVGKSLSCWQENHYLSRLAQ